ncbi:AAA family ATPase [candidate division CSSED10-310 bacterium]|uniref:AAA family ATPase n=1 Tax=candidate division CSSED10-310 bacterium TaxID=2855610 RepID=A0ABV6YSD5_UNCC1
MILKRLKIKNFRQFVGEQTIEFALPEEGKNTTVIFGENGRGKTSIFRAIMFCLYGDLLLSQDENVDPSELHLINSTELQKTSVKEKPVKAYVALDFSHNSIEYSLCREMSGLFMNERHEQIDSVSLYKRDQEGNTIKIHDPDEVNRTIHTILDRDIREYFLFDGEKIQKLTLANMEQKREVSRGMKNLLQVSALERAIRSLHKLKISLNEELGKRATGEYGRVLMQLTTLEEEHAAFQSHMLDAEEEYHLAQNELRKIEKKLAEYEEIRELVEQRNRARDNLDKILVEADNLLAEMKTKTGKAAFLLLSKTVERVFKNLDEKREKGEIPAEIRKDLIEKILTAKQCICSRPIQAGSPEFEKIIEWKNKTYDVQLESSALDVWRYLSSIRSHSEEISVTLYTLLHRYGSLNNEREKLRLKIESLDEEIGQSERKDASKLEKHRKNIETKMMKIELQQSETQDRIVNIAEEVKRLSERKVQLEQEEKIRSELSQRANLADQTHGALTNMFHEFTEEIKDRIMRSANEFFQALLDDNGKQTLQKIVVNKDFSLQILDKWGTPFLANISAGQRQIMSISFIAALAKIASSDTILEMPFFMDTPFGRLSADHRKNLIEHIPDYCAQWILLATDTEFRQNEASMLKRGGKWGKFYQLQGLGPGITEIVERNIDEAQAILNAVAKESAQ